MAIAALEDKQEAPLVAKEVSWEKTFTATTVSMRTSTKDQEGARTVTDKLFSVGQSND